MLKNFSCNSAVTGPLFPSLMVIWSTDFTGVISAAVPVKNISSEAPASSKTPSDLNNRLISSLFFKLISPEGMYVSFL